MAKDNSSTTGTTAAPASNASSQPETATAPAAAPTAQPATTAAAAPSKTAAAAPIPGTVRLVNPGHSAIDVTLTDGTNVRLGPARGAPGSNMSGWIPKKLIPPSIMKQVARKKLRMQEAPK